MPLHHHSPAKAKPDLSKLRMTNCSSPDISPLKNDEGFVELLWENGQVVMQGQSNRTKKSNISSTNFGLDVNRAVQEKNSRNADFPKVGRMEMIDSFVNDFCLTEPSNNLGLNAQGGDMVPWISYPIEDSVATDYYSEFLSDISGVNLNTMTAQTDTQPVYKRNSFPVPAGNSENTGNLQIGDLWDHCQMPAPSTELRTEDTEPRSNGDTRHEEPKDLPSSRLQKKELESSKQVQPSCSTGLMNFSHFSRPVAIVKANLESVDRLKASGNVSAICSTSSTAVQSSTDPNISGIQQQHNSVPNKPELRLPTKPPKGLVHVEPLEAVCKEDKSQKLSNNVGHSNDTSAPVKNSNIISGLALGGHENEKANEVIITSSSVCSANTIPATSNDGTRREKRKANGRDESDNQSDDLEYESVDFKKPATLKGKSAKRSRAAEVHNLSERRRRDRINEKMRALQELIPNCNKVDKASMLDEAIEYLKSLQLQIQMMAMGSGLCMPPIMLPTGMQQMSVPPMAHFQQLGLGMQMGMRMGYGMGMLDSSGCPLLPVPPVHGQQFPCTMPSVPGPPSLQGISGSSGYPMFGVASHGFPASVSRLPQFMSTAGLSGHVDSVPEVAANLSRAPDAAPTQSKDQENLNLKMLRRINDNNPQATKESVEQSAMLQVGNQTLQQ